VIRGARIGPSPDWLTRRLATCGVGSINNVVDVTNYV
jgi:phenylalanyl-tRNA synthetase beta chain